MCHVESHPKYPQVSIKLIEKPLNLMSRWVWGPRTLSLDSDCCFWYGHCHWNLISTINNHTNTQHCPDLFQLDWHVYVHVWVFRGNNCSVSWHEALNEASRETPCSESQLASHNSVLFLFNNMNTCRAYRSQTSLKSSIWTSQWHYKHDKHDVLHVTVCRQRMHTRFSLYNIWCL